MVDLGWVLDWRVLLVKIGLDANLSYSFWNPSCFNHLFYKLAFECNCLSCVKSNLAQGSHAQSCFEEFSVYTLSYVHCLYWSTKIYVFVWPLVFKQRLQREGGWVPLYCGLSCSFEPPTHPTYWWKHPSLSAFLRRNHRIALYSSVFRAFFSPESGRCEIPHL